jgi:hypothetical protein
MTLPPSAPYTPFHEPDVVVSLLRNVAVPVAPEPAGVTVNAEEVTKLLL